MYLPSRRNNFVHLIGPIALGSHRNSAPSALWERLHAQFVHSRLFLRNRGLITNALESFFVAGIDENVFVSVSDCFAVFTRISLLPNHARNEAPPPESFIKYDLQ